jgi:GntR family transcriptional regulator/MocR family aminotransferase
VVAAYDELSAEGWITTSQARGTFVSRDLPDPKPRQFSSAAALRTTMPARTSYELRPALEMYRASQAHPPGILALAGGVPDIRLVPAAELVRAYRRVLRTQGGSLLSYGDSRGHLRLRKALAEMLSATRGIAASPETVLVTRGSQMALYLVARTLVAPGDVVVVESPGYRPAWEAFQLAGARLVPLQVDDAGACVRELQAISSRDRIRAVYLTPHHQYPTTVTLAAGRRLELLEFARKHRVAVIEDDYDHEFHYEGRPVLPLASVDTTGAVIYIGTLSKVLAPGLRVGYIVAPEPLLERAVAYRSFVDLQGDLAVESAVAELLEGGEVQRHVRRARRIYQGRRDLLAEELERQLGTAVSFTVPSGGMALWARVQQGVDLAAWEQQGLLDGVAFQTGRRFTFDHRMTPYLRLGFASRTEAELKEAVRRMAKAFRNLPRRKVSR